MPIPRSNGPATKLTAGANVRELSRARLPTAHGEFLIVAFSAGGRKLDDVALIRGDVGAMNGSGPAIVSVRLHSECLTGDVLGSLRCDCGDQLHTALTRLSESERGILLYMRQEGRGIGIANKVAAYALQDDGLDTVEANQHLGFDDDLRRYDVAAGMLRCLGASRIELHTNNPRKVDALRAEQIEVVRRVPLVIPARDENRFYLSTKMRRSGHLLQIDELDELDEREGV